VVKLAGDVVSSLMFYRFSGRTWPAEWSPQEGSDRIARTNWPNATRKLYSLNSSGIVDGTHSHRITPFGCLDSSSEDGSVFPWKRTRLGCPRRPPGDLARGGNGREASRSKTSMRPDRFA
jgi:hypothetical protein